MVEFLKLLYRAWKYRLADNPEEISYLLNRVQKGETVLDIGAHKGGYTYWMCKAVGPKGRVIAFEPQQKGARLLQHLFPDENVIVEHKALSNHLGKKTLYIQPQAFEVSFEASLEQKYPNAVTELIETTTLDQYCGEQGLQPSFLKIDVEGHEEKVLEGAREVLRTARPVVLVECESRHAGFESMTRVFDLFKNLGYSGFFYRKGLRTPLEQFAPESDQKQAGEGAYINNFFFEP